MVRYDINKVPVERQTGVLVTKHDPYTIPRVRDALRDLNLPYNVRTDFAEDCATKLHCGLPLFRIPYGSLVYVSIWSPA
jgi:hypothetical protein